jgi:hypothetical protein
MEAKDIGQRINELIFRLNKNQSSFAKSIGVTQTAVYSTVHGKTKPRYEFIESILLAYPNINKEWLMEGKGEMFVDTASKVEPAKTESGNDGGYLLDILKRIEDSFKSNIEEKDRVIADQRFIIDTLKNQVAALSSVNAGFIDPNTGEPKMNFLKGDYDFEAEIRA